MLRPSIFLALAVISISLNTSNAVGGVIYNFVGYSDPETGYSVQGTIETSIDAHIDGQLMVGEILDLNLSITDGVSSHSWDENDPFIIDTVSISESQIFIARPQAPIGASGTTSNNLTIGTRSDGADGELIWVWQRRGFTTDELLLEHRTFIEDDFTEDLSGIISDPDSDFFVIANASSVPEPSSLMLFSLLALGSLASSAQSIVKCRRVPLTKSYGAGL